MATALIDSMFSQASTTLANLMTNEIAIVASVMIFLCLVLAGGGIIIDFLGLGLSSEERDVKSTWGELQRTKGTWREDIARRRYKESLDYYFEQDNNFDKKYDEINLGYGRWTNKNGYWSFG